jgi:hypothetical protein
MLGSVGMPAATMLACCCYYCVVHAAATIVWCMRSSCLVPLSIAVALSGTALPVVPCALQYCGCGC